MNDNSRLLNQKSRAIKYTCCYNHALKKIFLQNELTEKNKIIKSLMETQTTVLDVMVDLIQQPNTPEQNVTGHLSQEKFNQNLTITETKIIQEKSNAKEIRKLERKRN